MKTNRVEIPCGKITLEGELTFPDGSDKFPVVVVCHPHPLYGGDMDNNVVRSVGNAAAASAYAVLKFNFRGVGKSKGTFDSGWGERDDVKAGLDFLVTQLQIDAGKLFLAGYSFGGAVALSVAVTDSRVKGLVLISPAIDVWGWEQFREYKKPKLVMLGDADVRVSFRDYEKYFGDASQHKIIPYANHSWWKFEDNLENSLREFFKSCK